MKRKPKHKRRKPKAVVADADVAELETDEQVERVARMIHSRLLQWKQNPAEFRRARPGRQWTQFGFEVRSEDIRTEVSGQPVLAVAHAVIERAFGLLQHEGLIQKTTVGDKVFFTPLGAPQSRREAQHRWVIDRCGDTFRVNGTPVEGPQGKALSILKSVWDTGRADWSRARKDGYENVGSLDTAMSRLRRPFKVAGLPDRVAIKMIRNEGLQVILTKEYAQPM